MQSCHPTNLVSSIPPDPHCIDDQNDDDDDDDDDNDDDDDDDDDGDDDDDQHLVEKLFKGWSSSF